MREEILDIAKKLYHNHLTIETGTDLLLGLHNVSQQRELLAFEEWCKVNVKVREYKEAISDILERYRKANCG